MAVKHTILPRWATNDVIDPTTLLNNVIEPAEAKKDIGWNYIEKPARQYFNWLGRQTNQWLDYLNDSVNMFAPYETDPATMAISLNAGRINLGTDVLNVAAQDTGTMTAPITNPRIDRIVIDETSGVASIIAGSEAASPTAPTFTLNQIPIAQILLYVGMTEILNADITDERSNTPVTESAADYLFLTKPDSTGIGVYSQNSTTGATATDGFLSGIDANEKALLWNYENTDLLIGVNNALAGKVANDGKWLITPNGTDIVPTFTLVLYESAVASDSYIQFINDGTGITAADGLIIGIDATERATIRNRETTDLLFYTADIIRGKVSSGGNWLITPAGGDIVTPANLLVVYNSGVGSASAIQFLNDGTGTSASDGFSIGIDTVENVSIWNYESTEMRFANANAIRGKIDTTGNWLFTPDGVNLTPGHEVVIYTTASAENYLQFVNSTTGSTSTDGILIGLDSAENGAFWNYEGTAIYFGTSNLERMRIEADGSVEIGTGLTNQGAGTLNVTGGIYINNNLVSGTFNPLNTDLNFGTNNIYRGKVDNGGKWLISPNGTNIEPNHELVIYNSVAANDSFIQFLNDATGIGAGDGLIIGVDTSERALIWNYEATDLHFGTSGLLRGKISGANGNWLISPDGTDITPARDLVIYDNAGGIAAMQFCNLTTGVLSTDGFFIGINATEQSLIWNYENTDLFFATNNTFRGKIDNGGNWLISPAGTDFDPAQNLVVYDTSVNFMQFVTAGTGTTGSDGFLVGVNGANEGVLLNYENTDISFWTFNTERMRIDAGGSVLIGTGLANQGVGTLNVLNGIYINNKPLLWKRFQESQFGSDTNLDISFTATTKRVRIHIRGALVASSNALRCKINGLSATYRYAIVELISGAGTSSASAPYADMTVNAADFTINSPVNIEIEAGYTGSDGGYNNITARVKIYLPIANKFYEASINIPSTSTLSRIEFYGATGVFFNSGTRYMMEIEE